MAADGGSSDKKRLKLMPEVLPAPKRTSGAASARQRTMRTMERLIAVSAAGALIAGADAVAGCGYGVVDPMPGPSNCPNVAPTVVATAKWKLDAGKFVVVVDLSVPGKTDASYTDLDPSYVSNGTLVNRTLNQGALTLTIEPTSGAQSVGLNIPIKCDGGGASLSLFINTGKVTPLDGAAIDINVSDSY